MSERPDSITNEDILRWSEKLDNDPLLSPGLLASAVIREVCYAGQWLAEKLTELNCSEELMMRILFTAGQMSFGHNPWTVHQDILDKFINDELEYED